MSNAESLCCEYSLISESVDLKSGDPQSGPHTVRIDIRTDAQFRKTFLKDGRVDEGAQRRWSNGTLMDGCAIDVQLEERAI
jgi:hypothetical protein